MVWLEGGQTEISEACPPPPPELTTKALCQPPPPPPPQIAPPGPPPHRPSLNPPSNPPPGAFGPLVLGGGGLRTTARRPPPRGSKWPRGMLTSVPGNCSRFTSRSLSLHGHRRWFYTVQAPAQPGLHGPQTALIPRHRPLRPTAPPSGSSCRGSARATARTRGPAARRPPTPPGAPAPRGSWRGAGPSPRACAPPRPS